MRKIAFDESIMTFFYDILNKKCVSKRVLILIISFVLFFQLMKNFCSYRLCNSDTFYPRSVPMTIIEHEVIEQAQLKVLGQACLVRAFSQGLRLVYVHVPCKT